jgi:hypothetical protein
VTLAFERSEEEKSRKMDWNQILKPFISSITGTLNKQDTLNLVKSIIRR